MAGAKGKQIAHRLGLDPKMVRRYLRASATVVVDTQNRGMIDTTDYGENATTMPVVDRVPGEEIQADTIGIGPCPWVNLHDPIRLPPLRERVVARACRSLARGTRPGGGPHRRRVEMEPADHYGARHSIAGAVQPGCSSTPPFRRARGAGASRSPSRTCRSADARAPQFRM